MSATSPASIEELGLQGSLYLWALLSGQKERLPIGQNKRTTLAVLNYLHERHVITVPWPDERWALRPNALSTPIENLAWELEWDVYEPARLSEALEDYFDSIERNDLVTEAKLRLWIDIGSAETGRFFEGQLIKHRLPSDWAQDAEFAYHECSATLSLAQWRYCAWAAVRCGASLAMQQSLNLDGVREAIYQEIRRRAVGVASGKWNGCAFTPFSPQPDSALGRGLAYHVTHLGRQYWTKRPSVEAIWDAAAVSN